MDRPARGIPDLGPARRAPGHGRGRPARGLVYLATGVLVVVVLDPWLSRSVGFWLSVLATFGLLWWARPWTDALAHWLPRWAAESVAVQA